MPYAATALRRVGRASPGVVLLAALTITGPLPRSRAQPVHAGPQVVAELDVYVGWRAFGQYCARCHGQGAQGSEFAPNLPERMGTMTEQAFATLMERGYPGMAGSLLGPWGRDPVLASYYGPLWAYLRARATAAVAAGPLAYQPATE